MAAGALDSSLGVEVGAPGTFAAVGAAAIATNLNVLAQNFGGGCVLGGGSPQYAPGSLPTPLRRGPGPRPP
jgi:hypothetical protein